MNRKIGKTIVAAVMGWSLLLFVAAPRVHADDRSKCQHAIEKAEARLDRAIRDKGEHSREAENRRRDLNAEREHCWIVIISGGTEETIAGRLNIIGTILGK